MVSFQTFVALPSFHVVLACALSSRCTAVRVAVYGARHVTVTGNAAILLVLAKAVHGAFTLVAFPACDSTFAGTLSSNLLARADDVGCSSVRVAVAPVHAAVLDVIAVTGGKVAILALGAPLPLYVVLARALSGVGVAGSSGDGTTDIAVTWLAAFCFPGHAISVGGTLVACTACERGKSLRTSSYTKWLAESHLRIGVLNRGVEIGPY